MDNYLYKCHYCGIEYLPKRRNKQKYCCNSCRVNAFNIRNKAKSNQKLETVSEEKQNTTEKINMAGIGNAAIANVGTELVKNLFMKEENKPATKGDLLGILSKIQSRYLPVKNIPQRSDGAKPFYDTGTETVVYRIQLPPLNLNGIKKPENFQFL